MLDALHRTGVRVLLPVAVTDETARPCRCGGASTGPANWSAARFGLLEPAGRRASGGGAGGGGSGDRAGTGGRPARVSRLGRGAGFYDRSLPLRDPTARLIAVVRDDELLDEAARRTARRPMTDALTPGRGVVAVG